MSLWRRFKRRCYVAYFTVKSLSHNSSRPNHHYIDALLEPVFWFVDNFTTYMGVIFVVAVTLLTGSVVTLWYMFLLPVIQTYPAHWILYHCVIAHYLLVNIVFHYYKAVLTHPGSPPYHTPMENLPGAVVCKKCIQPKPPRAHHCSICNQCFLKMDHHCPWMNNCIGFYNHRYFVSFCVFMWLGTIYVSTSTFDLFFYHFFHPGTLLSVPKRAASLKVSFGFAPLIENVLEKLDSAGVREALEEKVRSYRPHPGGFTDTHTWEHVGIIYLFFLCTAVTIALTALNLWHFVLITRGETSIEVHVNNTERNNAAMRGMAYNNQYHYGWKMNLKLLFGIHHGRNLLCVFFPSSHVPQGDGISWPGNKKPLHYPDPQAYDRYKKRQNSRWKKFCPC